eukprot:TRINITY_DN133_c0_g1_i1.p1 TRINITY_DN133_c0_g1~~TRINITY_DN133_c0_g1_i1.p1  ORF type:complete len:857 (+),score=317.95 TRINITY_DN133_c0_g1_i1:95-2665(+)
MERDHSSDSDFEDGELPEENFNEPENSKQNSHSNETQHEESEDDFEEDPLERQRRLKEEERQKRRAVRVPYMDSYGPNRDKNNRQQKVDGHYGRPDRVNKGRGGQQHQQQRRNGRGRERIQREERFAPSRSPSQEIVRRRNASRLNDYNNEQQHQQQLRGPNPPHLSNDEEEGMSLDTIRGDNFRRVEQRSQSHWRTSRSQSQMEEDPELMGDDEMERIKENKRYGDNSRGDDRSRSRTTGRSAWGIVGKRKAVSPEVERQDEQPKVRPKRGGWNVKREANAWAPSDRNEPSMRSPSQQQQQQQSPMQLKRDDRRRRSYSPEEKIEHRESRTITQQGYREQSRSRSISSINNSFNGPEGHQSPPVEDFKAMRARQAREREIKDRIYREKNQQMRSERLERSRSRSRSRGRFGRPQYEQEQWRRDDRGGRNMGRQGPPQQRYPSPTNDRNNRDFNRRGRMEESSGRRGGGPRRPQYRQDTHSRSPVRRRELPARETRPLDRSNLSMSPPPKPRRNERRHDDRDNRDNRDSRHRRGGDRSARSSRHPSKTRDEQLPQAFGRSDEKVESKPQEEQVATEDPLTKAARDMLVKGVSSIKVKKDTTKKAMPSLLEVKQQQLRKMHEAKRREEAGLPPIEDEEFRAKKLQEEEDAAIDRKRQKAKDDEEARKRKEPTFDPSKVFQYAINADNIGWNGSEMIDVHGNIITETVVPALVAAPVTNVNEPQKEMSVMDMISSSSLCLDDNMDSDLVAPGCEDDLAPPGMEDNSSMIMPTTSQPETENAEISGETSEDQAQAEAQQQYYATYYAIYSQYYQQYYATEVASGKAPEEAQEKAAQDAAVAASCYCATAATGAATQDAA